MSMNFKQYRTREHHTNAGRDGFIVTAEDRGEYVDFQFMGVCCRILAKKFHSLYRPVVDRRIHKN